MSNYVSLKITSRSRLGGDTIWAVYFQENHYNYYSAPPDLLAE